MQDVSAWVLTDGKAGDEQQCLGVTEALGVVAQIRRVAPRAPYSWAMPWGPVDPRESPGRGPLAPPYPDLVVASGRRAVPSLRALKRATGGRVFTVFLKDPRTGPGAADLIWVPAHDRLRGGNVLVTLTPPHRLHPERLAAARASPDPRLAALPGPRVAVLVGGPSRHHRFTDGDVARLGEGLASLAASGASLMGTLSRRSGTGLREEVRQRFAQAGGFLWDGTGENPYLPLLALADAVLVTADSYNMVGEAAATGVPVLVFEPTGGHPKLERFVEGLKAQGIVHPFRGLLEGGRYEPLNSTRQIAEAVGRGLARHRLAHP